MEVQLVRNICLHQQHQVIVTEMHGLDGLGKSKYLDVLDIVRSNVDTWGSGRPVMWQQWGCVESVTSMIERESESDRHYGT